jgi:hypothetical protein
MIGIHSIIHVGVVSPFLNFPSITELVISTIPCSQSLLILPICLTNLRRLAHMPEIMGRT